jgi:hypothetical protein
MSPWSKHVHDSDTRERERTRERSAYNKEDAHACVGRLSPWSKHAHDSDTRECCRDGSKGGRDDETRTKTDTKLEERRD